MTQVVKAIPTPFDVDDTLIMTSHGFASPLDLGRLVDVICPLTGKNLLYKANEPMIRLLEEEIHKGSFTVVWSRSGYAWAEAVVKGLGLFGKVNLIMDKPLAYFDDKEISDWLRYRVYINPDVPYKNK